MIGLHLLNENRKACSETKQLKKKADATKASIHNGKSKAVTLLKEGKSAKEVAKQTKISITTINKYTRELRS